MDKLIPLFVAIPLGVAFIIPMVSRKFRQLPDILANLTTLSLVILSLAVVGQEYVYHMGAWKIPVGIVLVLDGLSRLMLIIVSLISFAATLFSVRYMERYTSKLRYYSLFLLMVGGMNGVILSGDMFNLYVFLEIASIASYALVGFGCEHEELEASFKYLVLGSVASTFILFGVAVMYSLTGTLNMADLSVKLTSITPVVGFACCLFILGFGLKAALVPFHAWLPDAHPSAPAPISAMLSGVLIKALGVYALARFIFNVVGISPELAWTLIVLGGLSMVIGVFLAVGQWDFKRLLAYHSISQMGYVVLGLGIGAAVLVHGGSQVIAGLAILGGLFHLINHAVFKSLLFLCSGSVEYATRTRQLKELGGLAQAMPLTRSTCTIASMAISGIPPFNGFWSKLIIVLAAVQAKYYILAGLTVLVSFITLVSFLKVQRYIFLGNLPEDKAGVTESPGFMRLAMVILAGFCIGMGVLLLPGVRPVLLDSAVNVLISGTEYARMVLGG